MNKIGKLILLACALSFMANAQPGPPGISLSSCAQTAVANPTTGTTVVLASSASGFHVCQVQIQVVQGASPANYSVVYGQGSTCSAPRVGALTPVWAGHASQTDYYWYRPAAEQFIPKDSNICLVLSATPTAAAISLNYR